MSEDNKKPITAHFLYSYLPLSETFIYQYLRKFAEFTPIIIADTTANLERFPLKHKIYRLEDVWNWWTWKWVEGRINERILRRSPFETMIKHIFNKEKPSLIHAHSGVKGVDALPVKLKYGLPMITTFYGMDMSKLPRIEEWKKAYQKLFEEGELFLVEGRYMRNRLIELGCPAEKVKIQHIAINLDDYRFAHRVLPEDGVIKILMCARLTEKKGIEYAIAALDLVRYKHKKVELRIIGDGDLRPKIESLIKELKLDEIVILLGAQSHSNFIEELKQTHIFLAPSVTAANGDSEGGAPTVLLEAQAAGVPVVSTYHADIPGVVLDGKSGFLVPERDIQSLAEKLCYLIEHPENWEDMGDAGRAYMSQNHDISVEVINLEEHYGNLINGV